MRIRVVGQAGEPVFTFSANSPWAKFKDNLINDKYRLVTEKYGQKIDVLICHGYSKKAVYEANESKVPKNKRILVLWEPPITHPKLHSDEYLSNFGYIYTPSKEWAKKYDPIHFNWPIGKNKSKFQMAEFKTRHKNAVIMQGNKVNFFRGENYSLRRTVLFKSLRLNYPIILYGSGWGKLPRRQTFKAFVNFLLNNDFGFSRHAIQYLNTKYPFYEGVSKNKYATLEKYKISIVIENHNTYVSEKIFDSLNSHCITIYIGPNLADYGLNKNIAIQSEPNTESILNTLEKIIKLDNKDLVKLLKTQQYHLRKVIKNWNNEKVLSNLAKNIRIKIKK